MVEIIRNINEPPLTVPGGEYITSSWVGVFGQRSKTHLDKIHSQKPAIDIGQPPATDNIPNVIIYYSAMSVVEMKTVITAGRWYTANAVAQAIGDTLANVYSKRFWRNKQVGIKIPSQYLHPKEKVESGLYSIYYQLPSRVLFSEEDLDILKATVNP
jgi:hypothetical protein